MWNRQWATKKAFCVRCNEETRTVKLKRVVRTADGISTSRLCAKCKDPVLVESKMRAKATTSKRTGSHFRSGAEVTRESGLLDLEKSGAICSVRMDAWTDPDRRQKRYDLVVFSTPAVQALVDYCNRLLSADPSMAGMAGLVNDVARSTVKLGTYLPDASYVVTRTGEFVVEDVKGWKSTDLFKYKKRAMLAAHGIDVKVVDAKGKERQHER